MSLYDRLGVRPIVNAQGHFTTLGGSLLPAPVQQAMVDAAQRFVDLHELLFCAGARVAALTRNDAAYICNGASSGLVLSALAAMTRGDPRAIARLPDIGGLPNELIVHRVHRIPPDLPILLTGARWREVGTAIGTRRVELEALISERTAAIVFVPAEDCQTGALSVEDVIAIGREAQVPVIVDAAAELPPPDNLWYFTRDLGADIAVFSGGKAMCGPQASGFIVGREDLIAACRSIGAPHAGVARAMKVGKEEIAGLVAALEWFLSLDHDARRARVVEILDHWEATFKGVPGVQPVRTRPAASYQWEWRIRLLIDAATIGFDAHEIRAKLWDRTPRVAVMVPPQGGELHLTPYTLQPSEEVTVSKAILDVLGGGR
jgi:D-glucosaminate-6-phosphate ammonia-lyase